MAHIKYHNKYGRVDPSFPTEIHFDRDNPGAHEDVVITKRDQWWDILFKAANVQLCVNEQSKQLETRKANDYWGWGGRWEIKNQAATCDQWVLQTEGVIAPIDLQAVYRRGLWLNNADGSNHVIIGSSELYMAWRFDKEGAEAIRPSLKQRMELGFNNIRVFWQKDIFNKGNPWMMPTTKMVPFLNLCAEYGLYVEGCILVDCQVVLPIVSFQQQRVLDVRRATAGIVNHFEQLGNEFEKNGFKPANFQKPNDRLSTNASNIENGPDAKPYWDYFTFSGQRHPLNHAIREYGPIEFMYGGVVGGGGVPAICGEGFKPGINSSDPLDYYRAGAQARSGVGGRFHSRTGTGDNADPSLVPSGLFTSLEYDCAMWFIKGMVG